MPIICFSLRVDFTSFKFAIKLSVAYNEKNFNHVTPYQYQLKEIVNPKSSVFKGWKIQGWFNISPGRCINVLPLDLTNIKQVYINANSDDRKYRWNGKYSFCVSNQAFNYKIVPKIKFNYSTLCRYNFSNDKIRNDGLFNLGFRKIRLPRAKNYTMNLL